jgi:hypothetical protein
VVGMGVERHDGLIRWVIMMVFKLMREADDCGLTQGREASARSLHHHRRALKLDHHGLQRTVGDAEDVGQPWEVALERRVGHLDGVDRAQRIHRRPSARSSITKPCHHPSLLAHASHMYAPEHDYR